MKRRYIITGLIIVLLSLTVFTQYPKLYIATGYGAKCLASGVFLAGRDPLSVKNLDLDYSIVKYTSSKIDYQNKTVTTSFWGLAKQTALFRPGLGCALINDLPLDSVMNQSFTLPYKQQPGVWRQSWPMGDRLKDTVFPEIDTLKLNSAVRNAFIGLKGKEKRTAAVVVVYRGEIVGEKYWAEKGITSDTRLWGWSMNKSILNALTGIMVRQGKLNLNAIAPVKEWLSDRRRDITLNDLMHMNSGLKWDEDYSTAANTTNMLFREPDCYKSAIRAPFLKKPGLEWSYSSGTANIISGIIRNTLHNDQEYLVFPYCELFHKTGMESMILETDAAGNFVGSSSGYANARDWARFGLLYYNDGIWQGDTILPHDWVKYTRTPAQASKGKFGALFWLNKAHQLPDAPEETYSCQGHRGQRIFIIPYRNLVIVRLGFSDKYFEA